MSTFEIDLTNEVFIFFSDFLLSWYIKLSWKYFLNKKPQKQPLCSLYCRGRQRLSTEHHCEVRHGTLRLSTRILRLLRLLLKVYSSLPTTHHNSTSKKFRLRYRYRNWNLGSVLECQKPGFGRTLPRTFGAIFWNYYLLPLTFYHLFEFPAKDSFWNSSGKLASIASIRLVMKIWGALIFQYVSRYVKSTIGELSWHLNFLNSISTFNCVSNVYNC